MSRVPIKTISRLIDSNTSGQTNVETIYEDSLPNTWAAFLGKNGGEDRDNVVFAQGDGGITMDSSPERIDFVVENGEGIVITDDTFDGDANNYFIDDDGYLQYYYADNSFNVSDFTEFQWGIDFADQSSLTLTGSLIDNVANISGGLIGNWSAVGAARPTLLSEGAAQFDGINNELVADFGIDKISSANDDIFIVAKRPIGTESYIIGSGVTNVATGDNFMIGLSSNNELLQFESIGGVGGSNVGKIKGEDGEYGLYHVKYTSHSELLNDIKYNGRIDLYTQTNADTSDIWFDDPINSELALAKKTQTTPTYYEVTIKEILSFSNLSEEKRKCIEVFLKFKHNIPVYGNN